MRVIRENMIADGSLTAVCQAAAQLLDGQAESLQYSWHQDRAAVRDLVEQIMALTDSAVRCPPDSDLERRLIRLRWSALLFLTNLADSQATAVQIGETLLADCERVLGPDHPDTSSARGGLALAYQRAGRIAEAVVLGEQTLVVRERTLRFYTAVTR